MFHQSVQCANPNATQVPSRNLNFEEFHNFVRYLVIINRAPKGCLIDFKEENELTRDQLKLGREKERAPLRFDFR